MARLVKGTCSECGSEYELPLVEGDVYGGTCPDCGAQGSAVLPLEGVMPVLTGLQGYTFQTVEEPEEKAAE